MTDLPAHCILVPRKDVSSSVSIAYQRPGQDQLEADPENQEEFPTGQVESSYLSLSISQSEHKVGKHKTIKKSTTKEKRKLGGNSYLRVKRAPAAKKSGRLLLAERPSSESLSSGSQQLRVSP